MSINDCVSVYASPLSTSSGCECRAKVTSLPLFTGITIKYFIYRMVCHACTPPPPVSHALPVPQNANETLAPHINEQCDVSSKYGEQMSLISWDPIWEEWIKRHKHRNTDGGGVGRSKKGWRKEEMTVILSCQAGIKKGREEMTAGRARACVHETESQWQNEIKQWLRRDISIIEQFDVIQKIIWLYPDCCYSIEH